jgi:hypothetical protein
MTKSTWFEVDREGLAQTVRRRHPGFIFAELVANSLDQKGTTRVIVSHEPVPGKSLIDVRVEDNDVTGFADLQDAFTLFRRTPKRADVAVRGRFNLGEKEFLSICQEARIETTIGTVFFKDDGSRKVYQTEKFRRQSGTVVTALVKMTREDYAKAVEFLGMVIPPEDVTVLVGGCMVGQDEEWEHNQLGSRRVVIGEFTTTLPTEIEDEEGDLRRTARKASVIVSEVPEGRDVPWLFEMGIPVCEIPDDKWDVNIQQKVPLARDRDSVTPGYLQKIRVAVVNNCHEELEEEDASQGWVTEAIADEDVDEEAFTSVVHTRFGEDAVIYDPSDKEANQTAAAHGRQIIYGGALPKGAHDNRKRFDTYQSAGQEFPTPKVSVEMSFDPEDAVDYTPEMEALIAYTVWLADRLMGVKVRVDIVDNGSGFLAAYGDRTLLYSLKSLGKKWFKKWNQDLVETHRLIIHEFAHEYEESHLSYEYQNACCKLGAKLTQLALDHPEEFAERLGQEVSA